MPIPQMTPKKNNSQMANKPTKPGAKKKLPQARKKIILKKLIIAALICLVIGLIALMIIFAWFSKDLPNPNKINERSIEQSTRIYDRTGEVLLYEIHGDTNRTLIKFENIPKACIDATVSIEDAKFYNHSGIDIVGIARAVIAHIFNWEVQGGGSTITQQFVKNAILTNDYSYVRKIKEAILAFEMERKFSKEQILQLYLNEIPYGSTAYGIESAAELYFGKSAKDLTTAQCATLAALPQSPSYYMNHQDTLLGRQQYVLERMTSLDYLTETEKEVAQAEGIVFEKNVSNITAPHFVFYVKELLADKYGTKKVEQGGLKVITSLDIFHQEKAEEAIAENVEKNLTNYNAENAGLVSVDTQTGQILAMVGSKGYFDETIDGQVNVTTSLRQPGSSFKPFVYLTAWDMGYTPETMLFDLETDFVTATGNYHPHNYDLRERGPVSMAKALMGSLNIPAVKTLYLVGVDKAIKTAEKFGYTSFNNPEAYGLSLVLGGVEVSLVEHTAAYAALARNGEFHQPTAILKVEDTDGKILEEWQNNPKQVFEADPVKILNNILSTDSLRSYVFGSGSRLTLPGRPVAAKTGTTNEYRDGWTMGYTPTLAAGVWAGNNDNSKMAAGGGGFSVAAPIWNSYMKKVTKGTAVENFDSRPASSVEKPILKGEIDEITKAKVDKFSEEIIPEECLADYPLEYIIEKDLKQTHTILHYVIKDNPRGIIPENPATDSQYTNWEAMVKLWASGQPDYLTEEIKYADCHQRDKSLQPNLIILYPTKDASLNNQNFSINFDYQTAANRNIVKVVYTIDTTLIDTQTVTPFLTDYEPSNLTSGQHTLNITIYDDQNNFTNKNVNFIFDNTLTNKNVNLNLNAE